MSPKNRAVPGSVPQITMKRFRTGLAACAALSLAMLCPVRLPADQLFMAHLDASQEVPPNESTTTGDATLLLRDDGTAVISMTLGDFSTTQTAAHIHGPADVGMNAGVIFPLPKGSFENQLWMPTEEQIQWLMAGKLYINAHTQMFPGGEIRGQLVAATAPEVYTAHLSGDQEVPPTDSAGAADITITIQEDGSALVSMTYGGSFETTVTAAHLHGPANVGENAGVIFPLMTSDFTDLVWNLTAEQLDWLRNGLIYANVHTQANPGGEIRGQLGTP